jgi:hypothetical protein
VGKIGWLYKKNAVLALFYCGCNQSKSFHIFSGGKGNYFFGKTNFFRLFCKIFGQLYELLMQPTQILPID